VTRKFLKSHASVLFHKKPLCGSVNVAPLAVMYVVRADRGRFYSVSIGFRDLNLLWSKLGIPMGKIYRPHFLGKSHITVMWKCAIAKASVMEDLNSVILSDLHERFIAIYRRHFIKRLTLCATQKVDRSVTSVRRYLKQIVG
jgi:hypothetical protein